MTVRPYRSADERAVVGLWKKCNLTRPQNNPYRDIERKLKVHPELFLVGEIDGQLVATVMGGYEGHRGWVNYLGVAPDRQRKGLGRQMMGAIEQKLLAVGCPKINLQVRAGNEQAMEFYRLIGYAVDDVVSMGRRLIPD